MPAYRLAFVALCNAQAWHREVHKSSMAVPRCYACSYHHSQQFRTLLQFPGVQHFLLGHRLYSEVHYICHTRSRGAEA